MRKEHIEAISSLREQVPEAFGKPATQEEIREAEFVATPSIIDITMEFRRDLPEYENMIVIGIDGAGNPIGFLPDNSGIFTNDHDFGGRYELAVDFNDYVEKALNGTLQASF